MTNLSIATSDGVPVPERIRPKDRDAVVQALRAGVVPRVGLQHIQVGRVGEVKEVMRDIDRIADGGSAVRFAVGDYGSGKSFFLTLGRSIALQRGLVAVHADLSPDRRIHATGGQARLLYAELMRNMATRTKQDGGALASVVERFIGAAQAAAKASGRNPSDVVREWLVPLQDLVSGFDFATAVERYWRAYERATRRRRRLPCAGCEASTASSPRPGRPWACAPSSRTPRSTTTSRPWPASSGSPDIPDSWSSWTS
jgi:hypothetical protein